jgi:hypothetical protein
MLCAMPDSFFSSVLMDEQSFKLPPLGDYAVGMVSRQLGTAGPLVCFLGGEEGRGGGGHQQSTHWVLPVWSGYAHLLHVGGRRP